MPGQENWSERLGRADVQTFRFRDDGLVPNSDLRLVVYRNVFRLGGDDPAALFEEAFRANGWGGCWRDGIYPYRHYHSMSHEALGVARGRAMVELGGEGGQVLAFAAGDAVAIPAGVAHRRVDASGDFLVVGAYPGGRDWDLLRDTPEDRAKALENLPGVPLPESDPLYGKAGPLLEHWFADAPREVART
jgi:uncharacterized protein YjlB